MRTRRLRSSSGPLRRKSIFFAWLGKVFNPLARQAEGALTQGQFGRRWGNLHFGGAAGMIGILAALIADEAKKRQEH
jgi:hypothetical protein